MLGRMNATMRFMVWGTMPLGFAHRRSARHDLRPAAHADDRGRRRPAVGVLVLSASVRALDGSETLADA